MTANLNDYPYLLPPSARYQLQMIDLGSNEEKVDFFYRYKRKTEHLYLGVISTKIVELEGVSYIVKQFLNYLQGELYLKEANRDTHLSVKIVPKLCWLADSYLTNGFQYPMCVHYNPRIQKNVMHPGSTRNHIISLFHKNKNIEVLYFNTGGVTFDFMTNFKIIEKDQLLSYNGLSISIALDHCSTIPHINLDEHAMDTQLPVWQNKIQSRLLNSNFSVYCDKELPHFKKWITPDENTAQVKIYIKDPNDKDDIVKACIMTLIGRPYESPSLRVVL